MQAEKTIKIINKLGLHARAATQLVKVAQTFSATCTICNGQKQADASSVLGLMMLESHQGQDIRVVCEGNDAKDALKAIEELIAGKFNEGE